MYLWFVVLFFFFSLINRASVAGFTNITFTMGNIIAGEDSYVSFSPCSEAVLLPQDPGIVNVKYRTSSLAHTQCAEIP